MSYKGINTSILAQNQMMVNFKYLLLGTFIVVVLAACNKENNNNIPVTGVVYNNPNNPVSADFGGAPALPSTASGGLYAINQLVVNGPQSSTSGSAFVWLNSDTLTAQADAVTCAGDSLFTQVPGSSVTYPWYETTQTVSNGFGNSLVWNITGSRTLAGFTDTDNTAFPTVTNYNLPATFSVSSPLTVSFSVSNPFDVIVFTLAGSKGVVTQTSTSAGSITFSVAQIDSATAAGDTHVGLQIMAIKTTAFGIGGKAYYFVKQYAYKEFANTTP